MVLLADHLLLKLKRHLLLHQLMIHLFHELLRRLRRCLLLLVNSTYFVMVVLMVGDAAIELLLERGS